MIMCNIYFEYEKYEPHGVHYYQDLNSVKERLQ